MYARTMQFMYEYSFMKHARIAYKATFIKGELGSRTLICNVVNSYQK